MLKPSKLSFMMKLTTPVTASAPYTADAPPVSTSTRSTSFIGIEPTSTEAEPCTPPTWRRPLTRTSVLLEPRPRRLRTFAPSAKPESIELSDVVDESKAGTSLTTSEIANSPDIWICSSPTDWTGSAPDKLESREIREPVTVISSSSSSWARTGPEVKLNNSAARLPRTEV